MTRCARRARRAQVLVYPCVSPGRFLAVAVLVLALAAGCGLWAPPPAGVADLLSPHGELYPQLTLPPIPARVHAPPRMTPGGPLFDRGTLFAPHAGIVDATVIGHTLHMGAGGPRIPIALGFALDGAALPAEALGRGLKPGETRSMAVPPGARVSFVTAARYDLYGAMEDSMYVRSDLPGGFADSRESRSVMLVHGDRVPHTARPGYGGQRSLTQMLGRMVSSDGRLVLPRHQAILAFEYTSHFHHPAADFQDLVVLVSFTGEQTAKRSPRPPEGD